MDDERVPDGWSGTGSWWSRNPVAAGFLGCGCLAAVVLGIAFTVLAAKVDWSAMPPEGTIGTVDVTPRIRESIEAVVPLEEDEEILWFYSAALFDYESDGNLLTDRRVISWNGDDDGADVTWFTWDEVAEVRVEEEGGFLVDALYAVEATDGRELYLLFAAEEGHHTEVLATLEELAGG